MMTTKRTLTTLAVVLGVATLAGCELPDPPSNGNGTPSTDPRKADLYQELTHPLPYSGGDIDGPCGSWSAATPQDAEEMAVIHRDCLKNPAKYGMG